MAWPVLLATAMAVLAAWSLIRLVSLKWNSSSQQPRKADESCRLPPGSRGLPLLGESLEFFTSTPSLELPAFFKRRLDRYGPVFRTNMVGQDLIVSLDRELNNFVFQQEERLFQIWYPDSFMRIIGADSIITTLGSPHKYIRNLVLRIFGPENLRQTMLREVQRTAQASLLSWIDRPSIEFKEAISSMIFSVTAKKLISYDSVTSDGNMWKQYDAFIRGLLAFPLCIPGTAFYKCMQGRKIVMKMLKELLDKRKKATGRQGSNIDFIDVMIEELKEEKPTISEKAALNLIFLLLFASFETTASAITAVLTLLTDNPEALQELTEEHENIQKRRGDPNSEITWEEYKSMKFTSHVIHEALRLANIAPMVFRKATEDVHIKGFSIPKGSKLMICPSSVHLNPVVYKDPNIFNPWRWKDTAEPAGGASKDFMAFGGGLRLCVGADFAKLQMAIFLHCLVTKYRWKAIKGGTMVLAPGLRFPEGFHIQLLPKA
ncbi:cytochrome P450 87A3-like [Oryza brachyantha]|nr:cytochrome P450 87A3-like [Oryza brachyantha]